LGKDSVNNVRKFIAEIYSNRSVGWLSWVRQYCSCYNLWHVHARALHIVFTSSVRSVSCVYLIVIVLQSYDKLRPVSEWPRNGSRNMLR